jgi:hypothetical protein
MFYLNAIGIGILPIYLTLLFSDKYTSDDVPGNQSSIFLCRTFKYNLKLISNINFNEAFTS